MRISDWSSDVCSSDLAATVDLVGLQPGDVLAVQRDAAGRDREAAGDEVEQRRLAGAIRADDSVAFVAAHDEGDAADDRRVAEVLAHVIERQRGHGGCRGHDATPCLDAPAVWPPWAASLKASRHGGAYRPPSQKHPPIRGLASLQP